MKSLSNTMEDGRLQSYYDAVEELSLVKSPRSLRAGQRRFFEGIELEDATVLDIGGGKGLSSCYASVCGAKRVVCLEPEGDGAGGSGARQRCRSLIKKLSIDNVEVIPETFQDFDCNERFDIILSQASINHLDEKACVELMHDPKAHARYRQLFSKLYEIAAQGAYLIISDCSPHNIFPDLGLKHPINRSIEWEKHQPPEIWACMLISAGFEQPEVRWLTYGKLGFFGRKFLSNKLGAYFLESAFALRMHKPKVEG